MKGIRFKGEFTSEEGKKSWERVIESHNKRKELLKEAISSLFPLSKEQPFVKNYADNISSLKVGATNGGFLEDLDDAFKKEVAKGNTFKIEEHV